MPFTSPDREGNVGRLVLVIMLLYFFLQIYLAGWEKVCNFAPDLRREARLVERTSQSIRRSFGRGARHRSAKPATPVQIRKRPHRGETPKTVSLFFCCLPAEKAKRVCGKQLKNRWIKALGEIRSTFFLPYRKIVVILRPEKYERQTLDFKRRL